MEAAAVAKSELRNRYRRDRELTYISGSWMHILQCAEFTNAHRIASYISYGVEPETSDLNQAIIKSGRELFIPQMQSDKSLLWFSWNGDAQSLKKKGKILEPVGGEPQDPQAIDLIIVPTLHANRLGYRLGQGGGSYDRALAEMSAWKLGLIYAGELSADELPHEPHDQRLDAVATPEMIIRFTNK